MLSSSNRPKPVWLAVLGPNVPMKPTLRLPALIASLLAASTLLLPAGAGAADQYTESAQPVSFKLTSGLYQLSGGDLPAGKGLDVNLRASSGFGNTWLGWFRSPVQGLTQTRAGWDSTFRLGPVRFTPSLQIASGGFQGGSAYIETGSRWFAGAGLGRTNLRPYVNLNFDPNDSWALAGGYRWGDNHSLALQVVRDNRLNPDQQHIHLVYRAPVNGDDRLTLDLLSKKGLVAGMPIHRLGLSVAYDWPRYFVRIARDPLVNFTTQDMLRLSVGTRF
jgi:hypothetical protein